MRITSDELFLDRLDGGSEVLRAVRNRDVQVLKAIIGRDPNALDATGHMGRGLLHVAVEAADFRLVQFLIESGSNVNALNDHGATPLFMATSAAIAQALVQAGARIHAKDSFGLQPIHRASQFARTDVVAFLLDHGSDVNVRDDSGNSPLHWATGACSFINFCKTTDPNSLNCVDLLLRRGADVNARVADGNVPLHGVAIMPNMEERWFDGTMKFLPEIPNTVRKIVQLLIENGADPNRKNDDGVSPLDIASDATRAEMLGRK